MIKLQKELNLLEFLQYILDCKYISDLKIEPYNSKARFLFEHLDLGHFSLDQIKDAINYIYFNEN